MEMTLNGIKVQVEEGWTVLDAGKFYGVNIPALCYHEGLSAYGACRLCVVEIGEGDRVVKARKMLIELLVARCPTSKVLQDLASSMGLEKVRFKPKYDDCILCGLCVRMCEEQMGAKAIGFVSRGVKRRITTPFDIKSDVCRTCGACMYICPACQLRCQGPEADTVLCSGCLNFSPPCVESYGDAMCYLDPCVACEKDKEVNKKIVKKKN
jgi:coenzyme F420 hydrogenase subunit beta